jgi:hypothetical protein
MLLFMKIFIAKFCSYELFLYNETHTVGLVCPPKANSAHPKSISNKNELVRTKTETNERSVAQFALCSGMVRRIPTVAARVLS